MPVTDRGRIMSKQTLAAKLRHMADLIEKLPESVDIRVSVDSHNQQSIEDFAHALSLGGKHFGTKGNGATCQWVEFKRLYNEPIDLTVFYPLEMTPEEAINTEMVTS